MMPWAANHKKCVICAGLCAAVLLAFWPALHFGFVNYDDPDYVTRNWHVRHGLSLRNALWAFTHVAASNWHPVTWLSHMLDCDLFGVKPPGHHLTSLLLHAANAALLFILLTQLTEAMAPSAMVAAIFALHPLRVESVVWISERKDVLSGLFFLLTLLAYVRHAKNPESKGAYASSLVFFALGLMAKPMLVTVPLILLLLDYWPLRRSGPDSSGHLIGEKIPFFVLSIAAGAATFLVQDRAGAVAALSHYSLAARLANAPVAYVRYIAKNFWPVDLVAFYPRTYWGVAEVAGSIFVLAAITIFVLWKWRTMPFLAVGWFWFLIMLLPVIGIVQVGGQSMANRYTYLPGIGLWIAVVWGFTELPWKAGVSVAAGVVILLLAIEARGNTWVYQNSEVLWIHTMSVYPDCLPAENNLIRCYIERGNWDKAADECSRALATNPTDPKANDEMSQIRLHQNRVNDALEYARKAIDEEPRAAEFHETLAIALLAKGDFPAAADACREAIALDSSQAKAWCNLGFATLQQGRAAEAVEDYLKALALDPDYALAHNDLGSIYLRQKQMDDAGAEFQRAVDSNPNYAEAHYNLAGVLAERGNLDEAIAHCQRALELLPQLTPARQRLAALQAQRERSHAR